MNSIIYTHFDTQSNRPAAIEVALHRLGVWMDAERDTLGRVLAQAGRRGAGGILDSLDQLHLDPDATLQDKRELLQEARDGLSTLLEVVIDIPMSCRLETAWGLPGSAPFDMHVRWSGARLTDIVAALDRALAA